MKKKVVKRATKAKAKRYMRTKAPAQVMVKGWSRGKDKMLPAKKVGKRTSKSGKVYYEYRVNRSDKNRKTKL